MENVREIILDTLLTMERDKVLSHELIRSVLDKYDYLDIREKAFIKRVTEGVIERRIELDYDLDALSSVPVKKMKPLIRCLLRMSVYQILYMDGIPDSAVCNEACKLAGKRKFQNLKGFVNGILRSVSRQKDHMPLPDAENEPVRYLSVKYSMPEMIVNSFREDYGQDLTESLLKSLLDTHPVSLRMTNAAGTTDDLKRELEAAGFRASVSKYSDSVLLVHGGDAIKNLGSFRDGRVTVQDISSLLAVKAAGIREGDLVIDACAAPGGKSIVASEMTGSGGRVICGDVSEQKLMKIRENIERIGADNIEVRLWDARSLPKELEGKADVLILDIPCSGYGVMGKKRDIKYHVTSEGLAELTELQAGILHEAWKAVKPGGILLYSTCTIRFAENRGMVKRILEELPFEPVDIMEFIPQDVRMAVQEEKKANNHLLDPDAETCCAQLLPGLMDADGFFFAKFRRKKNA